MTNLILDLYYNHPDPAFPDRPELGWHVHAQEAMKILGITYKSAVPESMFDAWVFFDCENIPETLPKWLTVGEIRLTS
jgi:hypothetical protein